MCAVNGITFGVRSALLVALLAAISSPSALRANGTCQICPAAQIIMPGEDEEGVNAKAG
jgi:hypothetical protein